LTPTTQILVDVLTDQTRRKLIKTVIANPGITTQQLSHYLELGVNLTSHHVAILRTNGILKSGKSGKYRLHLIDVNALQSLFEDLREEIGL
jgi:predicted transcriptional regulator